MVQLNLTPSLVPEMSMANKIATNCWHQRLLQGWHRPKLVQWETAMRFLGKWSRTCFHPVSAGLIRSVLPNARGHFYHLVGRTRPKMKPTELGTAEKCRDLCWMTKFEELDLVEPKLDMLVFFHCWSQWTAICPLFCFVYCWGQLGLGFWHMHSRESWPILSFFTEHHCTFS